MILKKIREYKIKKEIKSIESQLLFVEFELSYNNTLKNTQIEELSELSWSYRKRLSELGGVICE